MSPQDPSTTTTNGFCRLVAELFANQEAFAQFHQLPKAARLEVLARFSTPIATQQIDFLCSRMARWRSRRSTANKN